MSVSVKNTARMIEGLVQRGGTLEGALSELRTNAISCVPER